MTEGRNSPSGQERFPEPRLETYDFELTSFDRYETLMEQFDWEIPTEFNLATYLCERWANSSRRGTNAIQQVDESGASKATTFGELEEIASNLAAYFNSVGIGQGDRIGISADQRMSTVASFLACWKLGAIAVPISSKYGSTAIEHRFGDCEISAAVVTEPCLDAVRKFAEDTGLDELIVASGNPSLGETSFGSAIDQDSGFPTVATSPDEPALILYTSGTTGPPKGVVHSHQSILGMLPTYSVSMCNMDVDSDHLVWVPAAWSWIASLSFVLPGLYYGHTIFADASTRFNPDRTYSHFQDYDVSVAFVVHVTRLWRQHLEEPDPCQSLQVAVYGDNDETTMDWMREQFPNAALHQGYGQTEACLPIGHASALFRTNHQAIGRVMPGHEITVLDPSTNSEVPRNEIGELAIRYGEDPACLDGYWNLDEALSEKVHDGWLWTDDLARMDAEGDIFYVSRRDDIINCSGYRVGPEEIETVLVDHKAVDSAGVIGVPDEQRGEVPKAFVVLAEDVERTQRLVEELQQLVKDKYALYAYPRELEVVEELPRTNNGKIRRVELRRLEGLES